MVWVQCWKHRIGSATEPTASVKTSTQFENLIAQGSRLHGNISVFRCTWEGSLKMKNEKRFSSLKYTG